MRDFSKWNVYFGGAGFSCAFYVGVVKALQEKYPNQIPIIHADSAGTLVGLGYALNVPWEDLRTVYLDMLKRQQNRNNKIWFGAIYTDHDFIINYLLEKGNFDLIKNNSRFNVGTTTLFDRYNTYTNWTSAVHMRKYMHKSMVIPFLTKTQITLEIDGALSNCKMYDLTVGTNPGFDICIKQTYTQKLMGQTKNSTNTLINLGYYMTTHYTFQNNEKKPRNNYVCYKYFILLVVWYLKFISLVLRWLHLCN